MEVVLTLSGLKVRGLDALERSAAASLGLEDGAVSLIENDEEWVMIVYGLVDVSADKVAKKINALVLGGQAQDWLTDKAVCVVAAEEEEVFIEEDEAYRLWREEKADRTSHLELVSDPDGRPVVPNHEIEQTVSIGTPSPTATHLTRDPTLCEFDNVSRVHISELHRVVWSEPVVITGLRRYGDGVAVASPSSAGATAGEASSTIQSLIENFGDAEVRTGNRQTLIANGFAHSKPMLLRDALMGCGDNSHFIPECGRMVFSPVKELPEDFRTHLAPFTRAFPCEKEAQGMTPVQKHFTLCLANEGFGIGMHKHGAAMFLLLEGKKKWYMAACNPDATPSHPGFYTSESTHKCIQHPGELLFVPGEWFHEIFNLSATAGIQGLPSF